MHWVGWDIILRSKINGGMELGAYFPIIGRSFFSGLGDFFTVRILCGENYSHVIW